MADMAVIAADSGVDVDLSLFTERKV